MPLPFEGRAEGLPRSFSPLWGRWPAGQRGIVGVEPAPLIGSATPTGTIPMTDHILTNGQKPIPACW